MDIGFGAAVAGAWATPRNLAELARRAERLGYRSLWTFQRLLAPSGAKLAPVYRSVLDPMVSLGYLAAATSSIRLGVAVVNHPFASPLLLAKQAATVDVLSGGRLDLGIGSRVAGRGVHRVGRVDGRAGRAGRRVRRRAAGAVERGGRVPGGLLLRSRRGGRTRAPVQRPGPPVLIGGMSRAAMERAGRIGDGWVTASSADLSGIAESAKVVQGAARAAGRGPARIVCRGVVRPGRPSVSKHDRAAAAAVGVLRADPRGHPVAGKLRGHRSVL